jgi:hypothetical protein
LPAQVYRAGPFGEGAGPGDGGAACGIRLRRSEATASQFVRDEIGDPDLEASFLALQELSPAKREQARQMIEVLRAMEDEEFQGPKLKRR